jgi:transposase
MGTPWSTDLRERIVADVEAGRSCRAAARVFAVSTAARLAAACREHGDIRPVPPPDLETPVCD